MSSIRDTAEKFFEACETGQSWDGCHEYSRGTNGQVELGGQERMFVR